MDSYQTDELPLPQCYCGGCTKPLASWGVLKLPRGQELAVPQQLHFAEPGGADRETEAFARSILATAPVRSVYTYTGADGTEAVYLCTEKVWVKK